MSDMLNEKTVILKMRCPSCGDDLGEFPTPEQHSVQCPKCDYKMIWEGDCWDACVDKLYPRDFARQWVLWEAGRLGDPNVVYGNDPKYYFETLLKETGLTEEDLKSMKILEVAFGHGRLLHQLQQRSPTAYGLDLSRPLPSAQLRPGSAVFGNLLDMPFVPGQFDLVICRGVVHHTPDPHKSFDCVAQQVEDNGLLYFAGHYEPGIKGSLILRKVLPWSWHYPEILRLKLSSALSVLRAALEAIQTRKFDYKSFKRSYAHYKLDIFDVITPRWTSLHAEDEVKSWFTLQGFQAKRVAPGQYVGVKTGTAQVHQNVLRQRRGTTSDFFQRTRDISL